MTERGSGNAGRLFSGSYCCSPVDVTLSSDNLDSSVILACKNSGEGQNICGGGWKTEWRVRKFAGVWTVGDSLRDSLQGQCSNATAFVLSGNRDMSYVMRLKSSAR